MKKLIIILAAAAMTGCGIYKPYTRPEVKTDGLYGTAETADTMTIGNIGWERRPRRRLNRRVWLTCRRSTSHRRAT